MRRRNAMIIDDDDTMRFLGERMLNSFDLINEISEATNGREALEKMTAICEDRRELPEIILLDLHMPIMDGFQFLDSYSKIHCMKDCRKPVIIVSSSSPDPRDEKEVRLRGVRHYFTKPITIENIEEVLDTEFFR